MTKVNEVRDLLEGVDLSVLLEGVWLSELQTSKVDPRRSKVE